MSRSSRWLTAALCFCWLAGTAAAEELRPAGYGFGRMATEAEIKAWDIDVTPAGEGLPPGRGTVKAGAKVYAKKCAWCHGPTGTEGPQARLVGGQGTLKAAEPVKTVGSYWPHATTLYDYIHRTMPFTAPQSLAPDEVYALTAWILFRNGIIPEDAVIEAASLPNVQMPNRQGFVPDPRPDVPAR
jgi:cytochrome c